MDTGAVFECLVPSLEAFLRLPAAAAIASFDMVDEGGVSWFNPNNEEIFALDGEVEEWFACDNQTCVWYTFPKESGHLFAQQLIEWTMLRIRKSRGTLINEGHFHQSLRTQAFAKT